MHVYPVLLQVPSRICCVVHMAGSVQYPRYGQLLGQLSDPWGPTIPVHTGLQERLTGGQ